MYTKYKHLCCPASTVLIWLILSVDVSLSHYPFTYPCTCARLKNVVTSLVPICNPDGKGGFTQESIATCTGVFKATCPEFNEAECQWYNLSCSNSKTPIIQIPCCRLKYYATGYTWMEIYYTNQYGAWMKSFYPDIINNTDYTSKIPVFDIIEIHRRIKNYAAFGERHQADFPESVQNPKGERGLDWVIFSNLTPPLPDLKATPPLCSNFNDDRCKKDVFNYLVTNYPNGNFDPNKMPRPEIHEHSVSFSHNVSCYNILVNGKPAPACRVQYTRIAKEGPTNQHIYPFLEVQVYNNPPSGSISNNSGNFIIKYGYWLAEDPVIRQDFYYD